MIRYFSLGATLAVLGSSIAFAQVARYELPLRPNPTRAGTNGTAAAGPVGAAPANDAFATRVTLTGNSATTTASNVEATAETGEPAHASNTAVKSLWWQWAATQSGRVQLDTFGSSFDTVLAVYTGSDLTALRLIAVNDEAGAGHASAVSFFVTAGTSYAIVVDGWNGAAGDIRLNLAATVSPDLYRTDFESFPVGGNAIAGSDGWISTNIADGIAGVLQSPTLGSRAGYVGLSLTNGAGVTVGRPIGYEAVAGGTSKVQFEVDLAVIDSTNGRRDEFVFILYNTQGQLLAAIDFYNVDGRIYRYDGTVFHPSITFQRGVKYALAVTMDLGANTWFATLNGATLFGNVPINVQGRSRSLGMITSTWLISTVGSPGNNYLVFDNFRIGLPPGPPVISPPVSAIVVEGQTASFSAPVLAVPAAQLQWQLSSDDGTSWANLSDGATYGGATTATLIVKATDVSMDGHRFRLTAKNGITPDAVSTAATLTVKTDPEIVTPPRTQLATVGQDVSFSVVASAPGSLTYQWYHHGVALSGATSATLSLPNVTMAQRGWYRVAVTAGGKTSAAVAHLDVAISKGAVLSWGGTQSSYRATVPPGLGAVAAVAAGWTNYALRTDGSVVSWEGDNLQSVFPGGVVAIAAYSQVLGLNGDGTLRAAGNNFEGQAIVPAGVANVVAVAAGYADSFVLKSNGTVMGWGGNYDGQRNIPTGLTNVVAIAAGGFHVLALKADGSVIAWGSNLDGQATVPAGLTDVIAVAAGDAHSLALRRDGSLVAWGLNARGQCDIPAGLGSVQSIDAGPEHSVALTESGVLASWGKNDAGQLTSNGTAGVVAVSAGSRLVLAIIPAVAPSILVQPTPQSAGVGEGVQLSILTTGTRPLTYVWKKDGTPIGNAGGRAMLYQSSVLLANVQATDAGAYTVEVSNAGGTVTSSPVALIVAPTPVIAVRPLSRLVSVGQPVQLTIGMSEAGPFTFRWRRNGDTIAGATSSTLQIVSASLADRGAYEVTVTDSVGAMVRSVVHVDVAPSSFARVGVRAWTHSSTAVVVVPNDLNDAVSVSGGNGFSVAVRGNGRAVAWGQDYHSLWIPSDVIDAVSAAGSGNQGMILRANGTLRWWGQYSDSLFPAGIRDVVAVAGQGSSFGWLALRSDGTVLGNWGLADYVDKAVLSEVVALGRGFVIKRGGTLAKVLPWLPDPPAGLANVLAVAGGEQHYLALKQDGTVVGWGSGAASVVPAGLSNVVRIAAGEKHSLAVKSDGTLVGWGANDSGQLSPPASLGSVLAASGGTWHTAALVALAPPSITSPPISHSVAPGANVAFAVVAGGAGPFTYQWTRNDIALSGATNASLALADVTAADAGSYRVRVSNEGGSTVSEAAVLSVGSQPAIITPPLSQTVVIGGTISLGVSVTGTAPLAYQWKRDGTNLLPATNATLTITNAQAADSGGYTVVVSNAFGTIASAAATVAVRPPASPSIERQPRNQFASAGSTVTFSVGASGLPLPTYQWFKNGEPIAGATTATLTLTSVSAADATNYAVKMTNASGNVTSALVTLTLVPAGLAATHLVLGPGHFGGGAVTISNRFAYVGPAPGLDWQVLLPAGWSYASTSGADGATKPTVGETALAEWKWTTLPASPVTFSYTLNVPAGATGPAELVALIVVRPTGDPIQLLAVPDPLTVHQVVYHLADTNRDRALSLFELTRVIELYNTRNGTVRTGAYRVDASNFEDGFSADSTRVTAPAAALVQYHSADTRGATTGSPRDGMVDLFELTRVIELYNTRAGTVRTGRYHVQEGTEDGFGAGP